ncbi:hypothetical protein Rsub_12020 [Raphidocelis subcapitata]|uniref:Chitin-binding type-4 domain-containing protein n=1 Tax=Raphidocelis subcapitata TaxID=307507 RepID=A0A2V0PGY7_9CHLO|nr:hypothetical protein Rsub_12020 [Raphidocelis subcapitata]|eukprot:GBF99128.1 hypothetical protein Rsub_12020 [Raphidocelis subcapitata]
MAAHRATPLAAVAALPLAALLLLLAAALVPRAAAHAVMLEPKSRSWIDYLENYNYRPHEVFAGGVRAVSNNGALRWPQRNRQGICGDAAGQTKWDAPGRVVKTYRAGQAINVDILFAQNHLGRVNVRVCPLDATDERQCRTLERADGKGADFDLPWTPGWWGVTDGYTAPAGGGVEGAQLYKLPAIGKPDGCAAWACDQFKGMWVYRTLWKLPAGFTCDHCKLQMEYLTGSRCWPPCNQKGGCGKPPVGYGYCGEEGQQYPEEFWNCADLAVRADAPEAEASAMPGGGGAARRLLLGA